MQVFYLVGMASRRAIHDFGLVVWRENKASICVFSVVMSVQNS